MHSFDLWKVRNQTSFKLQNVGRDGKDKSIDCDIETKREWRAEGGGASYERMKVMPIEEYKWGQKVRKNTRTVRYNILEKLNTAHGEHGN